MKKINTRLDAITNPFYKLAPWFFRIALGVAFFIHGYKKLPAPFMMEEQHRMVTWFESLFMPFPELIVSLVIFIEIFGGIGIIPWRINRVICNSSRTFHHKVIRLCTFCIND
jgi:uncharacterized membrane protein YphA (DoxX/SURF4 family)